MMADLEEGLERYCRVLEQRFGRELRSIVAFGSQIAGTARAESDLDVVIVVEGLPRRRSDRFDLLRPLARSVGEPFASALSLIALTPEQATSTKPFYLGMLDAHRIVLDRDGFFREILERLERRLAALGARRLVDAHGEVYWDLKPDYVLGEDIVL